MPTKSKEQQKKEGPQKGRRIIPKRLLSGVGADLEDIILKGKQFYAIVDMAVESAPISRTIEGASTIELGVHDPNKRLIRHPMFESPRDKPVKLELDDLNFMYVKMAKAGKTTTLTFEDREIHWLRRFRGPKKAFRGRTTRAEFVLSLIRAIRQHKIPVVIPELHKKQPQRSIDNIRDHRGSEADTDNQSGQIGLGQADLGQITVKRTQADLGQLHVIDVVLDTGMSMGANVKVLTSSIMVITQESVARNLTGGHLDSVGPFQQRPSMGWPASGDIATDAKGYFAAAIREDRSNPGQSLGDLCFAVQVGASPSLYSEWEAEAKNTLRTYLGGQGVGGFGTTATQTVIKPYAFEVKKDEDYWEAIKRLAKEVRWRAFFVGGVFFFIAEEDLYRGKVHLQINEESQGIDNIDFDFDAGKEVTEVTVTAHAKRWGVPPGMVVRIGGMGPANGKYLVSTVASSLLPGDADLVTITLKKPTHSTKEPAPETETNTLNVAGTPTGNDAVDAMLAEADRIDALKSRYLWGGGHGASSSANGPWDCSGAVSRLLDVGGFLRTPVTSGVFASMYEGGVGEAFTIFGNADHVFVRFGDRYWGTSSENPGGGPGWHSARDTGGFSASHPKGT